MEIWRFLLFPLSIEKFLESGFFFSHFRIAFLITFQKHIDYEFSITKKKKKPFSIYYIINLPFFIFML